MTHEKKSARDATAIERWNRAVSEAYAGSGAGPDDLLELSDEEIERQLVAAGVDLAETDARAAATYDAVVVKLAADRRRGAPRARTTGMSHGATSRGSLRQTRSAWPRVRPGGAGPCGSRTRSLPPPRRVARPAWQGIAGRRPIVRSRVTRSRAPRR